MGRVGSECDIGLCLGENGGLVLTLSKQDETAYFTPIGNMCFTETTLAV